MYLMCFHDVTNDGNFLSVQYVNSMSCMVRRVVGEKGGLPLM
jgi:hypothetical protein